MATKRPPPWRWLLYAVGFGLPERYDDWVFHDLNDSGWRLREVTRIMLLPIPFIVGAMFLPGDIGLRLMTASFLVIGPLFVGAAYSSEFRAYRLRQHGLLPPSGPDPD
jgi:hypothetical protein